MKMAFPEALRNICGRCKADKGRCKSCPVTRIAEEYGTEEYSFHQLELIRSMIIRREGNWFTGSIDSYPFQVKVAEEDSPWGIMEHSFGKKDAITLERSGQPELALAVFLEKESASLQ